MTVIAREGALKPEPALLRDIFIRDCDKDRRSWFGSQQVVEVRL
jgi:hypothetical protein